MRVLLILLYALLLSGCNTEQGIGTSGPDDSWWLGGADGGAFVNIKEDQNPDDRIYLGTIYFEHDKSVWYQGAFKLVGNLDFSVNKHDQYIFWDGERLHLKESSYLEPVDPIPAL